MTKSGKLTEEEASRASEESEMNARSWTEALKTLVMRITLIIRVKPQRMSLQLMIS